MGIIKLKDLLNEAKLTEGKKLKLDIEVPIRDPEFKRFTHNYLRLNKKYSILRMPSYSMMFGEDKWKKETHWKYDGTDNILYVHDKKIVDLLVKGRATSDLFESVIKEGLNKQEVVDRVYPKIAKNLGRARRGTPKVEFHSNIYVRVTGNPDAQGEANPYAEYNWIKNEIYLYTPRMTSEEQIIKALLHEYTHATQDPKKHAEYRKKGYKMDPYEKAAFKAEKDWRKYI